ncbi:ficolin-2-like [Physella acuta]|uniref:ficolin-2-like n=1 Tax=Physella acuta TaxID=109671 RepID=UPI0027DE74EB|nr:ficolin-2-like [Physella acuta]
MCFLFALVVFVFSVIDVVAGSETQEYNYILRDTSDVTMLPLDGHHVTDGVLDCAVTCSNYENDCYNFMFDEASRGCYLGTWFLPKASVSPSVPQAPAGSKLYTRGRYCETHEMVTPLSYGRMGSCSTAACLEQNKVSKTTKVLKDPAVYGSCMDVKNSTNPRQLLQLSSGLVVMCDTVTDGGGWTIFQRRVSGVVDFYRNWEEYKHGFGDFDAGEFYLGNENIYCLTFNGTFKLRIDMTFNGSRYYLSYSSFKLQPELEFYKLLISGFSGNASNCLGAHNGRNFSTYDMDHDDGTSNCAELYHGAWWYYSCHVSNFNGLFGSLEYSKGLTCRTLTSTYVGVDSTEMKFKAV